MFGHWINKFRAFGIVVGVVALGAVTVTPAQATLIQANDAAFGVGVDGFNLTQDTGTGLEWLDLTLSTSFTYDDVVGGSGGFLAGGFSIATGSQVDTFFTNAGATDIVGGQFVSQFSAASTLIDLVGCTVFCDANKVSQGLAEAEPFSATLAVFPFVRIVDSFGVFEGASSNCCFDKTFSESPSIGIWLMRPIPEPGSISLLILGLAGLGFMIRRRREFGSPKHRSVPGRWSR
jgi:hypothetical protein